jgi:hypothetical protein
MFADEQVLGDEKVAPVAKRGVAHCFEPGPSVHISLVVAVIVY